MQDKNQATYNRCLIHFLIVEKNRYLLANSDTDSLNYKLATLSAIHFMNWEHTKLFELKAQKWDTLNK